MAGAAITRIDVGDAAGFSDDFEALLAVRRLPVTNCRIFAFGRCYVHSLGVQMH